MTGHFYLFGLDGVLTLLLTWISNSRCFQNLIQAILWRTLDSLNKVMWKPQVLVLTHLDKSESTPLMFIVGHCDIFFLLFLLLPLLYFFLLGGAIALYLCLFLFLLCSYPCKLFGLCVHQKNIGILHNTVVLLMWGRCVISLERCVTLLIYAVIVGVLVCILL